MIRPPPKSPPFPSPTLFRSQIEHRLADLTDHIASVIQKYLRNQYKTIEDYNRAAGEVAEPYRVLVVANFPANFTPEAAKRLRSEEHTSELQSRQYLVCRLLL